MTEEERFFAEIAAQLTIAWSAGNPEPSGESVLIFNPDVSHVMQVFNKFRKILRESPQ